MQRHDKKPRRNRRRERSAARKGAEAVAAAVVIAGGTQAYADAVRFENDAHFGWVLDTLDIRLPADQQPGIAGGPSTAYLDYFGDFYPYFTYQHTYTVNQPLQIFSSSLGHYAKPIDAGALIGPGLGNGVFSGNVTLEFAWWSSYYNYETYKWYYDSGHRGLLPEDMQTYLGVRFDAGSGAQYGWIGVERRGGLVDVFAWGYETDPGVPIPAGVPEPGTLAMLAFGAAGLAKRRRSA